MWHEALEMLQNAKDLSGGHEQLFASLRISYDALTDYQRRMFLDAAFFFLGRRVDTAKHAWKGYGEMIKSAEIATAGFPDGALFVCSC